MNSPARWLDDSSASRIRRVPLCATAVVLLLAWAVGILGRGYWTPDEPREADIAWRMSWQADRAVPLLAGEPFCEKPPLTYWVAAASIAALGPAAWAARLPNLLYAVITALAVGWTARRGSGSLAGVAAAAAIGTFLLSYQVAIWLATDAPLLAATAVALLGIYVGFHAADRGERLRGYSCMHAALAAGFLCKNAAAWMVPGLTLLALTAWERRWREWLRWELYAGLILQAAVILTWVGFVYAGPEGAAHLKVFFWNNLVGRLARVDAPEAIQYAAAHRNSPGKYLRELPVYLSPWTLLVAAACRRAWLERRALVEENRPVRFALAAFVPSILLLSFAATARNIYLAPALPGAALLLGWWLQASAAAPDAWDRAALLGTAWVLGLAVVGIAAAAVIAAADGGPAPGSPAAYATVCIAGLLASALLARHAARTTRSGATIRAACALLLGYGILLSVPAAPIYRRVDAWQDLASVGRAVGRDAAGRPLVLFAADETTRAFVDMYATTEAALIEGPIAAESLRRLAARLTESPHSLVLIQLPGPRTGDAWRRLRARFAGSVGPTHSPPPEPRAAVMPDWAHALALAEAHEYSLPNGRRYALLAAEVR